MCIFFLEVICWRNLSFVLQFPKAQILFITSPWCHSTCSSFPCTSCTLLVLSQGLFKSRFKCLNSKTLSSVMVCSPNKSQSMAGCFSFLILTAISDHCLNPYLIWAWNVLILSLHLHMLSIKITYSHQLYDPKIQFI